MQFWTQPLGVLRDSARALVPRMALAAVAVSLVAACEQDRTPTDPEDSFSRSTGRKQTTFYGTAVKVGEGLARTYITTEGGTVLEVGVALSEAALRGLPGGHSHSDVTHAHADEHLLPMHPHNPTPYRFVELNWVPDGHTPPYNLPHFDFHFYTISQEERNAIDPADPLWSQRANNLPVPELVPTGYVPALPPIPGSTPADVAVPRMGVHWLDLASPELNGAPYTETFLYGSWDGRMIFAEPMITKAFLETKPNFTRTLPRAQQGSYPGSYRIYWNEKAKEYRVALAGLPRQ